MGKPGLPTPPLDGRVWAGAARPQGSGEPEFPTSPPAGERGSAQLSSRGIGKRQRRRPISASQRHSAHRRPDILSALKPLLSGGEAGTIVLLTRCRQQSGELLPPITPFRTPVVCGCAAPITTVVGALPVGLKALGYGGQSPPSWATQATEVAFASASRGLSARRKRVICRNTTVVLCCIVKGNPLCVISPSGPSWPCCC